MNFNFKILTKALKVWTKVKLCDQASASKSATNCCQLDPHHQLQQQKQPFELVSLHARVTSIKFTKREWVSEWVTDKARQRSDSGPIKTDTYTNTQQRSVKVAGLNYWTCSKASERLRDLKKKKSNLWKIKNMNCVNMLWMWKKATGMFSRRPANEASQRLGDFRWQQSVAKNIFTEKTNLSRGNIICKASLSYF